MRINRRTAPEADLTSLIDVLFILILFFALSTAMIPGQVAAELPEGAGAAPDKPSVVLTVRQDGTVLYDGSKTTLEGAVAQAASRPKDAGDLLVAADENLPYRQVAELLEMLRRAGVTSVALALRGFGS